MKRLLVLCVIILSSFVLQSCATLFNSPTQQVEIVTTPPNAKLVIDGKKFGTTPQVVNIGRKDNHVIKIELDGYEPYETQVTTKLSFYFWGNIFNGIIPGVTIDLFTGSMYDLFPSNFNIQLQEAKKQDTSQKKK